MNLTRAIGLFAAALCSTVVTRASAEEIVQAAWSVFAGREQNVDLRSLHGLPHGEPKVWFRVSKESRTIVSGSVPANRGSVIVPVNLPALKPGVAMRFGLELRAGSDQGVCVTKGSLWAFSDQPLQPGYKPAGTRRVMLYDPEGSTEKAFQSIGLDCETVQRADAFADATNAVLVVGEGVSLEKERALGDLLNAAVARGNCALLLAPKEGLLTPPERPLWLLVAGAARPVLGRKTGAESPFLDLGPFPAGGQLRKVSFKPEPVADRFVFKVDPENGEQAVGWVDAPSGGRFRACGVGLVENWDKTPAARWFLIEMIEVLIKED